MLWKTTKGNYEECLMRQNGSSCHLESRSLACKDLVVQHGFEDLFVAAGNDADGAEQLESRDLVPSVFGAQALSDDVDARRVGQHVSAASLKKREF